MFGSIFRNEAEDALEFPAKKRKFVKKQRRTSDSEGVKSPGVAMKMVRRTIIALLETFGNFKAPKTIAVNNTIRSLYDEVCFET